MPKKRPQVCKSMLCTKCVYRSNKYLIHMYKEDSGYKGWYAMKPNQTKSYKLNMYVSRGFGI